MTEIKSALTDGEWRAMLPNLPVLLSHASPDECWQQVALNNAALPDSDPRKITRADVELLESVDLVMLSGGKIPELAAKLAALLPPQ